MSTARALGLMLLVIVVGGGLIWGLVYWTVTSYDTPPRQFPASVTVPHRSCYADRCVQALPGGLIRVTDRAGHVVGVWWR